MSDYKLEIEEILEPVFKLGYEHSDKDYAELTQALTHLIETEKKKARIEELKDMLESDNDPTQCVHCEILSRLLELQGEVGFRDGKSKPFGKAEDIVAEIRKGEVE